MNMATPTDTAGVRQLVGTAQFYRRWIPAFSCMTAPLTDMLKKGVNFKETWGDAQDEAVAKIKTALTTHPCLRQLDPNKPIVLLTDASTTGIGGGIFQEYDGKLCAVSFTSSCWRPEPLRRVWM
jgi:hypothetical protein